MFDGDEQRAHLRRHLHVVAEQHVAGATRALAFDVEEHGAVRIGEVLGVDLWCTAAGRGVRTDSLVSTALYRLSTYPVALLPARRILSVEVVQRLRIVLVGDVHVDKGFHESHLLQHVLATKTAVADTAESKRAGLYAQGDGQHQQDKRNCSRHTRNNVGAIRVRTTAPNVQPYALVALQLKISNRDQPAALAFQCDVAD